MPGYKYPGIFLDFLQFSGFIVGNSRTSRMLSELVSSITKRSKPKPRPPEIALTGYQRGGRPVITGFFAFLPRVFPPTGVPFFSL